MLSSVRNSPRQSANAKGFADVYLCFLISASAKKKKKNTEAIGFLGITKNLFSNNKKYIYFCFFKGYLRYKTILCHKVAFDV